MSFCMSLFLLLLFCLLHVFLFVGRYVSSLFLVVLFPDEFILALGYLTQYGNTWFSLIVSLISMSPTSPSYTPLLTTSSQRQTQSCIPNTYPIPLLAPVYNENICPHWTERWEIRTRPFGCHVSTITTLTAIVSVLSTVTLVILAFLTIWGVKKVRRLTERYPDWAGRSSEAVWRRLKGAVVKFGGLFNFSWRTKGRGDGEDYIGGDGLPVVAEGIGERQPLLR